MSIIRLLSIRTTDTPSFLWNFSRRREVGDPEEGEKSCI